ncbi:MAG: pilus assembly protein PilV [Pseudomonadota bacterium]
MGTARIRRFPRSHDWPRVTGFVLLEALVALLVFSLGVVALMGLQSSMTRAQSTAKYRADAAYLASEVTGLMWSDTPNIGSYATASCAAYTPCNTWKTKVAGALPAGTVAVTVDTGTGDVTVTVGWTEPSGDSHAFIASTSIVTSVHG